MSPKTLYWLIYYVAFAETQNKRMGLKRLKFILSNDTMRVLNMRSKRAQKIAENNMSIS